jgi:tetratricopeptide (TPR) repeat protein
MKTLTVSCGLFIAVLLTAASFSAAGEKVHSLRKDGLKFAGKLGPGHASQVYLVNLIQGGTYVIDMLSPNPRALDPYLRLLDPAGKVLAVDDDGGDRYLSARIIFLSPATADYKIEATSADGANAGIPAGPFTLVIRRDDSKRADALERRVEEFRGKLNHSAAVAAADLLLKARQSSQSAKQWQIADARGLMQRLEKIATLPDKARAELAESAKQTAMAGTLHGRQKYRDAEPFYEKALAIHRKILGEGHPDTGSSCDSLADNLDAQGRHAEAARLREDVLAGGES